LEDIKIITVPISLSNGQATTLQVIIEDDSPTFTAPVQSQSVDEEGLAGGNAGDSYPTFNAAGVANDLSGVALTATANLNISWGADDNNNAGTTHTHVRVDQ